MGEGVKYSDVKAAETNGVAKDLATVFKGDHTKWRANLHKTLLYIYIYTYEGICFAVRYN